MICRSSGQGWELVRQPDHGVLACTLLDAIADAPHGPLEGVRLAVAHHDDGWAERDQEARVGDGDGPESFLELSLAEHLEISGESVRLAGDLQDGTTVIYHSVFLQYPPLDVREAIGDAIEEAGRRTRDGRCLAWVRFEPESVLGAAHGSKRYVLNVVPWTNDQRDEVTLADVDPHGRTLGWCA